MYFNRNPRLSLIIFSFNQENYIEKAILSALNQNYDNLEVVVSDDSSSDGTFLIVKNLKEKYRGNHRFIIRQNTSNLGLAENIKRGVSCSTGDFIIMAAGDDISFCDRALFLSEIIKSKSDASAIYTDYSSSESYLINDRDTGSRLTEVSALNMALNCGGVGKGATYCFRRDVFDMFNPLPDYIKSEDKILPFVASIIGKVYYSSRKTIYYRLPDNSLSNRLSKTKQLAVQDAQHIKKLIEIAKMKDVQENQNLIIKNLIILIFKIYYENSVNPVSRKLHIRMYYNVLYYLVRSVYFILRKIRLAFR